MSFSQVLQGLGASHIDSEAPAQGPPISPRCGHGGWARPGSQRVGTARVLRGAEKSQEGLCSCALTCLVASNAGRVM